MNKRIILPEYFSPQFLKSWGRILRESSKDLVLGFNSKQCLEVLEKRIEDLETKEK